MAKLARVQLGKKGVTDNFISTLKSHFEKHKNVKIPVLRTASRNREELKEICNKILKELGKGYTARIIGFTIAVRKLRKSKNL